LSPRVYALALISAAAALFAGVVGANLLIDPQAVFGTGFFGRPANANDRYERLREYQADPKRYDAILFGSSRAFVLPHLELSGHLDGARLANFAVVGGMLNDYLPTLEYVLRDKSSRGERLRVAVVQLDVDAFGGPPFNRQGLQYALPPAISGESATRFWWKLLTSIQLRAWRSTIKGAAERPNFASAPNALPLAPPTLSGLGELLGVHAANAQPLRPAAGGTLAGSPRERLTERPGYADQIRLLERFVALCRGHDIRLIVMAPPIGRSSADRLDRTDLLNAIQHLSSIVPLWDFTLATPILDSPEYWTDSHHFRADVGTMMVRRIFADDVPPEWKDFGALKGGVRHSSDRSGPFL